MVRRFLDLDDDDDNDNDDDEDDNNDDDDDDDEKERKKDLFRLTAKDSPRKPGSLFPLGSCMSTGEDGKDLWEEIRF